MKNTWHNNLISKKLNEEFTKDFSLTDIDGLIRTNYIKNNKLNTRLIIYESKNKFEKKMGVSQLQSLKLLNNSINWNNFDLFSGVFVLKIIDINNEILWYKLNGELVRKTNFKELYNIFSCKIK